MEQNTVETTTPVYNPEKKYTWSPEDQFVLSGSEFGIVLNALRATLNTPEAARILIANQANFAVESILAKYVESGTIKEIAE